MRRYTVKENHISSAVSKIPQDRQTEILLLLNKDSKKITVQVRVHHVPPVVVASSQAAGWKRWEGWRPQSCAVSHLSLGQHLIGQDLSLLALDLNN